MMFAAANFLAYSCRLRMVWFPDINHVESNVEKAVFMASGLSQVNEKVSFLARLPYGPRKDAGHWHSQMRQAFEALSLLFVGSTANHFEPNRIPNVFVSDQFDLTGPTATQFNPQFIRSAFEISNFRNLYLYSIFLVVFGFSLYRSHINYALCRRLSGPGCSLEMKRCELSSGSTCQESAAIWGSPVPNCLTQRRLCVSAF
jgi:hypothetical protein